MNTLPAALRQIDRTYVRFRNKKLSYFSGCDYFRLASHPAVLGALRDGLKKFGLNVAASRLTTGNHELYERLESRLAKFFDVERALLFSSGYLANLGVAQALAGNFSHALIDERAHASLLDAAEMLDCPLFRFRHRDPDDLERALKRLGKLVRPILLTDGMFSQDGSVAPLKAYFEILPGEGWILVDDAHSAGVLGKTGRGTAEYARVPAKRIIQTITLSKAFGVFGGAVLGGRELIQRILTRSRLFVANTPMPLPLASAALRSIELLQSNESLRSRLVNNVRYVKTKLVEAGYPVAPTTSPIVPMTARNDREIASFNRELIARGIYPPFIQYPGGPSIGSFRFALSSEHRHGQLDDLLDALLSHHQRRVKRC